MNNLQGWKISQKWKPHDVNFTIVEIIYQVRSSIPKLYSYKFSIKLGKAEATTHEFLCKMLSII